MGCGCGRINNKNKVVSNVNIKKCIYTDDRIRVCRECDKNRWEGKKLFCSIDNSRVPFKAMILNNKCPLQKWVR